MPTGDIFSASCPIFSHGQARRVSAAGVTTGYPHIHRHPQKKKDQKENLYYGY
jgi:hypothetical protein